MFSLHDCGDRDNLVYKATNVYSKVEEEIFSLQTRLTCLKLFSEGKLWVRVSPSFYFMHLVTFIVHFCSVMGALSTGILWFSYTREILELIPIHQDCH